MSELLKKHWLLAAVLVAMGSLYLWGLRWGLPSHERGALFLPSPMKSESDFYEKLEANRSKLYEIKDEIWNTQGSVAGELANIYDVSERRITEVCGWKDPLNKLLLHSYSSFLLRTVDSDEQSFFVELAHMNPRKFQITPCLDLVHTGVFLYGLGAWIKAAEILGAIELTQDIKHYYRFPEKMAKLYVAGRLYILLWVLLGAWFLYLLTMQFYGRTEALIAAFLYLAAPVVITAGHIIRGHIVGSALSLLMLMACVKLLESGTWKWYLTSGFLAGVTFGTQQHLWYACCAVGIAHAARQLWLLRRGWRAVFWDRRFWLCVMAGVLSMVIVAPYIVTDFQYWYRGLIVHGSKVYSATLLPWKWLEAWIVGMGLGLNHLVLACFAAGFWTVSRRFGSGSPKERFLIVVTLWNLFILGFYGGNSIGTSTLALRRSMPLASLACLYAAWMIRRLLADDWPAFKRWPRRLGIGVLGYSLAVVFVLSCDYNVDSHRATYMRAGRWINENIPSYSSVGLAHLPHTDMTPPFRFGQYALRIIMNQNCPPAHEQLPDYYLLQRSPPTYGMPVRMPLPFPGFYEQYELVRQFGKLPRWWDF
ncbi:MAG: glycosyltransferase family 39 protein [Elusimicrobia bacterium]|nr:glycosyltransferase family 39 protein [Elusimicrobiota bacterium]